MGRQHVRSQIIISGHEYKHRNSSRDAPCSRLEMMHDLPDPGMLIDCPYNAVSANVLHHAT